MNAPILLSTQSTDRGLYLGHNEYLQRFRYKGGAHGLVLGTTEAGKSTRIAVPNIATLPRSMIIMDPKGQLAAITARWRAEMGKVIILNPFNWLVDRLPHLKSTGWEPLAQLDPASPDFPSLARAASEAMIDKGGSPNSEFFDASMENLWAAACMWERLSAKKPSLRNVRETFANKDKLFSTLKAMSESKNYAVRIAGSRVYTRLTDTNSQTTSIQDVIETIMKNTAFLDDNRIHDDMMRGDKIEFETLHSEITTIYVILPVGKLRDQSKWLRLFFNMAIKTLLNAPPEVATLPPVLFILDEFGNLGRLPEIVNVLNIARDLRIQLYVFLQYLEQLKASYPAEWHAFFSSAGAITSFAANDWETAELLSKIAGKAETVLTNSGHSWGGGGLKSLSFSNNEHLHIHQLIEPEDFMRIGRGKAIQWVKPFPFPVRAAMPGYWEYENLAAKLDPNPFYHG